VLPNFDDAVCRLAVLVLAMCLLVGSPRPLLLVVCPRVVAVHRALGANDVCVRVHRGKLCRVGLRQWQYFATDRLEIGRVAEEDLEKDWWGREEVVWLGVRYVNR
jgi:hypothetical protein